MASAPQRSISTIRHAPVMLIAAPPGPRTSTRAATGRVSSCGAKTTRCASATARAGGSTGMPGLWIDRLVPETVRIHQGSETMVVAALGRLRAEDERMAGDAEAALGSLTWDRGLQAITQHGLQAFLWHEPPRKWLKDRRQAAHRRFAGAAAGPELDGRSWLEAVAAAELRGSGLATPPRSPWPWWPTCRPHRRARGLRPVDAHRHAGRTALAAGRRDLALEVFAAANR